MIWVAKKSGFLSAMVRLLELGKVQPLESSVKPLGY